MEFRPSLLDIFDRRSCLASIVIQPESWNRTSPLDCVFQDQLDFRLMIDGIGFMPWAKVEDFPIAS
jgi:hypothetical protein